MKIPAERPLSRCKDSISERAGTSANGPARFTRGHARAHFSCSPVALAAPAALARGRHVAWSSRDVPLGPRGARQRPRRAASTSSACTGVAPGRSSSGRTASRGAGAAGSGCARGARICPTRARARRGPPAGTSATRTGPARRTGSQYRTRGAVGARARVLRVEPRPRRCRAPRSTRGLAADHPAPRRGGRRVDQARRAALRRRGPLRRRPPHGRHQRLHARPSRPRSCAGSSSTTCRATAGTTSATTSSSTGTARSSRAATAASTRNVVGAHAQGFNTGSVGVAVIGNYDSTEISQAARAALVALLAWRLDIAHVDPLAQVTLRLRRQLEVPGGNARHPPRDLGPPRHGRHRLSGQRALRAARLDRALGRGRRACRSSTTRSPPARSAGRSASRARLSQPAGVDGDGDGCVGQGRRDGFRHRLEIDWTWDSSSATASAYLWTMDAGPDVREARGIVGEAATASPPPVLRKPPPLLLARRSLGP